MTGLVADIWRHPIKSHGREALERVSLTKGRTMPWDRVWAVAHEQAKTDGTSWAPCANFSRGSKAPALMAISARLDENVRQITLTHPDRPSITFRPDDDPAEFLAWVRPLMPSDRAASARIVSVPNRGMTDTDYPSISLVNMASNQAVARHLGQELSIRRWRGNLCIDGLKPREEFEWVGKRLRIGSVVLKVRARIGRCLATAANPATGHRDADTLGALKRGWGHTDFGVYAEVMTSGDIAIGDSIEVIN